MEVSEEGNERLKAAYAALSEAIDECLRATGMADGMITTSWVLYGHQAGFEDDSTLSGYFLLSPGQSQPNHVTKGLLLQALDEARGVGHDSGAME